MRKEIKAMPFEVAVACGYVPGRPQPWWRKWKNRFLLWLCPDHPPRVETVKPTTTTLLSDKPVDFLPGWPDEMNPSHTKRHYLESEGVKLADFEHINEVLNQTPEQVAEYWQKYWAKHDGKNVDAAVKPVLFGSHHSLRSEAEAAAKLMKLQGQAQNSYEQALKSSHVDPSLAKLFDDSGIPRIREQAYARDSSIKVCVSRKTGKFSIGREDKDQRRYWGGPTNDCWLAGEDNPGIWETTVQAAAYEWLSLITRNEMSKVPPRVEPEPGKGQTDQGQKGC